jgi:hypothetical protein
VTSKVVRRDGTTLDVHTTDLDSSDALEREIARFLGEEVWVRLESDDIIAVASGELTLVEEHDGREFVCGPAGGPAVPGIQFVTELHEVHPHARVSTTSDAVKVSFRSREGVGVCLVHPASVASNLYSDPKEEQ